MSDYMLHNNLIREYPGFVSAAERVSLINYLNINNEKDENWGSPCFPWHWKRIGGDPNYNLHFPSGVTEKTIPDLLERVEELAKLIVPDILFYNMKGHVHPHSSQTKPKTYYDVAGFLYLNDSYRGGDFIMPNKNITIKPKAGSLLLFEDIPGNGYGVSQVEFGVRQSISFSFYREGIDEPPE